MRFPDDTFPCFFNCSVNIVAIMSKHRGKSAKGNTLLFL